MIFLNKNFAAYATCTLGWSDLARQSFPFQKIAETLKINIFSRKFAESFLIHQRTIAKHKI